jgi:hypothetical protein
MNEEKRDFREETLLNAAEWQLLKACSGRLGLSKSATLRFALLQLGNKITREEVLSDTGIVTDSYVR